ncbi:Matrix-remodeling-associated protein [Dirofilaria immitis]
MVHDEIDRHSYYGLPISTLLMEDVCITMDEIWMKFSCLHQNQLLSLAIISYIHGNNYDENLRNPDTVMHPLPPYNYANFFQEYPKMCLVVVAFCAIAVSMYFWALFRARRKEQFDNIVLSGRFSRSILDKVHQRITDKNANATLKPNEVVASFNELYGKLATAKLWAKAKKLENAMTEDERREEQLIQQKQLDSICKMIMQEPEKFGLHDKSEITEQMKLYSI